MKITEDSRNRCYHVYTKDGNELYRSQDLNDVVSRCQACTDYISKGRKKSAFEKVKVGDVIKCMNPDYYDDVHKMKVTSIDKERDCITPTNPEGRVLYGDDIDR